MKRALFSRAAKRLLAEYGGPWARKAGDKATRSVTEKVRQRGYLDQSYDLDGLARELKDMYRQGRLSRKEWERAKEALRERLRKRYRDRS